MKNIDSGATAILYVDDEEMARKYFDRSFGRDHEVLTAEDADSAMAMLRDAANHVGIVVTDYRMPGRSGGELLRQIAEEFPQVVRILVTAYADRDVLLDTVNSGEVFRILEKPLDLGEVGNTLRLASNLLRERLARQQRLLAIEETLAFLAHELHTPLAAILNFARGVQRRVADNSVSPQRQAEIATAALAVADNAQYCFALLSSFADSIRDAGAPYVSRPDSTAHQLISSLLDTYPLSAAQRNMIRVDVQEDFRISALPNCVVLVLSSLLSNALRALKDRPAPSICFTIAAGGNPQIHVADNGPGIPPEVLERLTVDPVTTHADSGGNGWGMIFCKRIMQSFGGGILIHSVPGASTTVTLNFPAARIQGASAQ